jgi:hypothetical protein
MPRWQTALQWDMQRAAGASISSRSRFPAANAFGSEPRCESGLARAGDHISQLEAAPIEGAVLLRCSLDVQNDPDDACAGLAQRPDRNVGSGHNHGFELAAGVPGLQSAPTTAT